MIVKCEIRIKIKYSQRNNKNDNAYDGNIKKLLRSHHQQQQGTQPGCFRLSSFPHLLSVFIFCRLFKVTHGVCAIFMIIFSYDWTVLDAIAVPSPTPPRQLHIEKGETAHESGRARKGYSTFFNNNLPSKSSNESVEMQSKKVVAHFICSWLNLFIMPRHLSPGTDSTFCHCPKFTLEQLICIFREINDLKN